MANFNVNLNVQFGSLTATPSSINANVGDTITLIYQSNDGGFDPISLDPPANLFTPTGLIVLNFPFDQEVRTVNTSGVFTVTNATPSWTGPALTINVNNATPNQFTLNNLVNVAPNNLYVSNEITVSGINVGITASASIPIGSEGAFSVNGGAFSAISRTVNNGDKIVCRMRSNPVLGQPRTMTLDLNGVSDSWTVTTAGAGNDSFKIPSGFSESAGVSTRALKEFFGAGAASGAFTRLTSYRRSGLLVPNIPENNAISTTNELSLRSFFGAHHFVYWVERDAVRSENIDPSIVQQHTFDWAMNESRPDGNPEIGYGQAARLLEFRWRFIPVNTPSGVTVVGRVGSIGNQTTLAANTWSTWGSFAQRSFFFLDSSFSAQTNGTVAGTVEVEVRNQSNTAQSITPIAMGYNLNIGTAGLE
ncbi:MAG: hypothetical protein JJU10_05430 [Idiomarina sp.]|nr:hypothetical protein [Idiomarina sp.]